MAGRCQIGPAGGFPRRGIDRPVEATGRSSSMTAVCLTPPVRVVPGALPAWLVR